MRMIGIVAAMAMLACSASASEVVRTIDRTSVIEPTPAELASFANYLSQIERDTSGFSTFFTRQALNANSYDEYMALYPKIVEESEERHRVYLRENLNYANYLPANATTCAFVSMP